MPRYLSVYTSLTIYLNSAPLLPDSILKSQLVPKSVTSTSAATKRKSSGMKICVFCKQIVFCVNLFNLLCPLNTDMNVILIRYM